MARLTAMEREALENIMVSEFGPGNGEDIGADAIGAPVWTFSALDSLPTASRGGVAASLSEKGFAAFQIDARAPEDNTVAITAEGFAALESARSEAEAAPVAARRHTPAVREALDATAEAQATLTEALDAQRETERENARRERAALDAVIFARCAVEKAERAQRARETAAEADAAGERMADAFAALQKATAATVCGEPRALREAREAFEAARIEALAASIAARDAAESERLG